MLPADRRGSKALCTVATGPHVALLSLALPGFEAFARAHGYDLLCSTSAPATTRPPAWEKVLVLQEALKHYDWVLWLDADALIVRPSVDPVTLTDLDHDLYLVEHRNGRDRLPNTGVWLLRSSSVAEHALAAMWALEQYVSHPFWENAAFMHVLGYRVPSHHRGMRRIACSVVTRVVGLNLWPARPVRPSVVRDRTAFLGEEWNHLVKRDGVSAARILHYAGLPLDERLRMMQRDVGLTCMATYPSADTSR